MKGLTGHQKILLAAAGLRPQFSEAELVLAAWRLDPKTFGLPGMEARHPSDTAVVWRLSGPKGLVDRNYLDRVALRTYCLTKAGREEVLRLEAVPARAHLKNRGVLPKAVSEELYRLLRSKAYTRFTSGRSDHIEETMALAFWNASPESVHWTLCESEAFLIDGVIRCQDGQEVASLQLDNLKRCHSWLEKRFARLLERKGVAA